MNFAPSEHGLSRSNAHTTAWHSWCASSRNLDKYPIGGVVPSSCFRRNTQPTCTLQASISSVHFPLWCGRMSTAEKLFCLEGLSQLQSLFDSIVRTFLVCLLGVFLYRGVTTRAKLGTYRRNTLSNPRNDSSFVNVVGDFKAHITSSVRGYFQASRPFNMSQVNDRTC